MRANPELTPLEQERVALLRERVRVLREVSDLMRAMLDNREDCQEHQAVWEVKHEVDRRLMATMNNLRDTYGALP